MSDDTKNGERQAPPRCPKCGGSMVTRYGVPMCGHKDCGWYGGASPSGRPPEEAK